MRGTVVDASSAASGGRPGAVRGFDHVDLWQASGLEERASEIAEDAKFVRKCARGHAKDCSHKSMSRWRSASSKVPTVWREGRRSLQEAWTRLKIQAGKPSHRQLSKKKKTRDLHGDNPA